MVHQDRLSPQLREWIRVLMLPPEQLRGEDRKKRRQAENYLCENHRQVLRLYYGYNLSLKEAAVLLRTNAKAFSCTLSNAKKRLEKLEAGKDAAKVPAGLERSCRNCAYGCSIGGQLLCDYAGIAGHSRMAMGAKLENGVCRLWAYKTEMTQERRRDLHTRKWEKQCY